MHLTVPNPPQETPVARAKRTDRAEARRRHRAATANLEADETLDASQDAGQPSTKASSSGATKNATAGTPARIGFVDAFRMSFRPVNVRKDIAAVPWIATHTHALWIPIAVTVGSTILTAVSGATDTIANLLFTYFVMFPAIGSMFIVGFLAPRASWLLGVIVGLVSAVCYIVLGTNGRLPTEIQLQWTASPQDAVVTSLIYSAFFGAFFASGAAWYRRFLALSSPNRGKRQSQTAKAKPGDGRTRTAGAKR
jgi:hypothetical protein